MNLSKDFWNTFNGVEGAMFDKILTGGPKELEAKHTWWNESAKQSMNKILEDLPHKPEWKLLEIGCGIGRIIKTMRQQFSWVDGLDIAPNMIKLSEEYLSGYDNGKQWVNDGITFGTDSMYDLVYSIITFQHIASQKVVNSYFKEALRVLNPSGYFKLQVHDTSAKNNPRIGAEETDPWNGIVYEPEELKKLLIEAGFKEVIIKHESVWIWATAVK